MLKLLPFLLVVALAARASADDDYCSLCPRSFVHTMCAFPTTDPGSACTDYKSGALSDADKAEILDRHNELRNKIALGLETLGTKNSQPSASNMRKMVWDNEAAEIAQRWANQCIDEHDRCRNTIDGVYNGQNFAKHETSGQHLPALNSTVYIDSWYIEVKKRDGATNTVPFKLGGGGTGHFTQMVWAETYKVGCGYVEFTQSGKHPHARQFICNYKPGGNILGDTVYRAGSPASECPAGTEQDSDYPGLCS